MNEDVTKIELAKALKAIKALSTEQQFDIIKKTYIQDSEEESVMSAVNGLSEEDEFAMLTKLIGTASHIIGLEQRPIIKGDYVVPDFFVNFKMGCLVKGKTAKEFNSFKCLIEVKSTKKDNFKIGGSKLQKLRNASELIGHPLFFAIRFLKANQHAVWTIIEDDKKNTSINVTYQSIIDGVRNVLWDEYVLTPNPKLLVICKFSKSSKENSVIHAEFGTQIEATFTDGKNTISQSKEAFMTCGLLEAYNLQEIKVEKISEDITLQYLKPQLGSVFLADLIYRMNNLIADEFGNVAYDASKLLVRSDTSAHDTLITREIIEILAQPLIRSNLLFIGAIGDMDTQFNKWKEYGNIR